MSICSAVARRRRWGVDQPPLLSAFEDICRQARHRWRDRLLPPLVTLALGLEGVQRLVVNPPRPGRSEPRAIHRRGKPYSYLTCPRNQWNSSPKTKENA